MSPNIVRPGLVAVLGLGMLACGDDTLPLPPVGCPHSHNDYENEQPLFNALEAGACSVEADVVLVGMDLRVAHSKYQATDPNRTLQTLYLDPLRELATKRGYIFREHPLVLLVDIKSEAKTTYETLHPVLMQYRDLVTHWIGTMRYDRSVLVVISGNRPVSYMRPPANRYASIDGRISELAEGYPQDLMPVVSADWRETIGWDGRGEMPTHAEDTLQTINDLVRGQNRMLRFWGHKDKAPIARKQREHDVHLIGTDNVDELVRWIEH